MTTKQLPKCISAQRIGHWTYGSESEYDMYGERAPITWICRCGDRLTLEILDHDNMSYSPVPEAEKTQFLAEHNSCPATCCGCNTVIIDDGYWCDECKNSPDYWL
jgi:hypothetical protein